MELDQPQEGPKGDEPEEAAIHESTAELEQPIDDSALRRIDRECFDELSAWLSEVSMT